MRLITCGPAWSRTEGTALSRHRTATLEATRPASTGATNGSRSSASAVTASPTDRPRSPAPAVKASHGGRSRSSRHKRGLFRRGRIVLLAFGLAVLLVALVTAGA